MSEPGGGSEAAVTGHRSEGPRESLSLDVQHVSLLQAKAGLMLVKEGAEGPDVHGMIQIHHILGRLLNLWHCDWLTN